MGVKIIITEKPSVAKTYANVLGMSADNLGKGYIEGNAQKSILQGERIIITWAVGHLVHISDPAVQNEKWGGNWSAETLPMIPTKFKYEAGKDTIKQFNIVKTLYTRPDVDAIYYAGDSAREGIFIQALIRNQIFHTKPNCDERVVWISSFADENILNGLATAKPYDYYTEMIDSGYARAEIDWLIGMNFTRAVSVTSNTLIRVGRVLIPTLAMLLKRQQECENYVERITYGIKVENICAWKADKNSRFFGSPLLNSENAFNEKKDAQTLIDEFSLDKKLKVESVKKTTKYVYAPQLYNLTDLQALGAKSFKITPDQTLAVIQSLYEKKYTTYPRTNSRHLDDKEATKLKELGYDLYKYNVQDSKSKKYRFVDNSEVEDHFAVIPDITANSPMKDPNTLTDELEKKFYEAIVTRFLDATKPPMVYDAYSVCYVHSNNEHFYGNFRIIIDYGWKQGYNDDETDNEKILTEADIPKKDDIINVPDFVINEIKSKPPTMFTSGTIIVAMEKAGSTIDEKELALILKGNGIGTPATRGDIIKKLALKDKQGRSCIVIEKNQKITVTDFGKKVIEIIKSYDENLISAKKTAEMENKLHNVASKEIPLTKDEYMNEIEQYVRDTVAKILANNTVKFSSATKSGNTYNCPNCSQPLKFGKYGFFCECGFRFATNICGKDLSKSIETLLQEVISNGKTKLIKGFTSQKQKDKKFDAYIAYNKEQNKLYFEYPANDTPKADVSNKTYNCPCCNNPLTYGKYGYYCDKTNGCGFNFGITIGNRSFVKDIEKYLTQIIENGKTELISGFISKQNKPYEAFLALDKENNKLTIKFQ